MINLNYGIKSYAITERALREFGGLSRAGYGILVQGPVHRNSVLEFNYLWRR